MRNLEYLAQIEQQYRETALYPMQARDAAHLRDLELADQSTGRLHRAGAFTRQAGSGLLASLRARFGWRRNGFTSASRS